MIDDLTIIYITASLIPDSFAEYQRKILLEAIGDTPLISVSRKPLDFGINLLDEEEKSLSNIYFQMLRAAKYAKTNYVAVAEDDTLYPREHFTTYRPPLDTFTFNLNRLSLFTWGTPTYSWRMRRSNCAFLGPTKLTIEALEERFERYPKGTLPESTGELGRVEKGLGLTPRKAVEFFSPTTSIIQFNHDFASELYQKTHRKRHGVIRAYDIYHWGKAADQVAKFK